MINRIVLVLLLLLLTVLLVKRENFYQVVEDDRCDGTLPYVQHGGETLRCIGVGQAQRLSAEQFQNLDQCPEEHKKIGLC